MTTKDNTDANSLADYANVNYVFLRDVFAAHALTGLASYTAKSTPDQIAHDAFQLADAMIRARKES